MLNCTLQQKIVRIQECKYYTAGFAEAGIERIDLPGIPLALPICQVFCVFPDDLHTSIRGASIHDEIFQVRVALFENGSDCILKEIYLVIGWGHHTDTRKIHGGFLAIDFSSNSGDIAFPMDRRSDRLQQGDLHFFDPDDMEIGLDEPEEEYIWQHFFGKTLVPCTQEPICFFHSRQSRTELTDLFNDRFSHHECAQ